MKVAGIITNDIINGPGFRVSVFCSGCPIKCEGCHNKEYQDFEYGTELTEELINDIMDELKSSRYKGLSLLGGEPFAEQNIDGMIAIAEKAKKLGKDIWIWSGFTYEVLKKNKKRAYLLSLCDVLVDGPFIKEKKDINLKFRGSSNQRIIELKKS